MGSIILKNISKKFIGGEVFAGVRNIDLSVGEGKILAIIGASGSGKSTLLKLIYGQISPDEGEVLFNSQKVIGPEEKLIPGHDEMKMVSQHFDLNWYASVRDNIASLLPNTDIEKKEKETARLLNLLRIAHLSQKRPIDLSGGEQQRTAIARALISCPKVLLMDEPFNQVDASFRDHLQHDIRAIVRETGITVVLVSHDPSEVLSLADELLVLYKGDKIESGKPADLYHSPKHAYTAQILVNGTLLSKHQAIAMGLKTDKHQVLIYPEHVQIRKSWLKNDFLVTEVLFKGFYEELTLVKETIKLKSFNPIPGCFSLGDRVNVHVKKFVGFDEEFSIY